MENPHSKKIVAKWDHEPLFWSAARSAALGRSGIQEVFSKSSAAEGKAVLSLHSAPHCKGWR